MLKDAHATVKRYYFDPDRVGADWDARHLDYRNRIASAPSFSAGLGIVAAFVDGLKDSHTHFQPPPWATRADHGYDVSLVGDIPYVLRVRPGSDADGKLRPGDRVVSINGNTVSRESFARMQFVLTKLAPQASTRVVVETASGEARTIVVRSTLSPAPGARMAGGPGDAFLLGDLIRERDDSQRHMRSRIVESGRVLFWTMPSFFADVAEVDALISRARKHDTVILDLRDNAGGLVPVLQRLTGGMFDRDVTIGTRLTRAGTSPLRASGRGDKAFAGRLIVLINSRSGSSSELFARVVQLEDRGVVIGDRSAGVVREGRLFPFTQGDRVVLPYAIAVSQAEILMKDGVSLERVGVTPDHMVLPTPHDLATGRDPALEFATRMAGTVSRAPGI